MDTCILFAKTEKAEQPICASVIRMAKKKNWPWSHFKISFSLVHESLSGQHNLHFSATFCSNKKLRAYFSFTLNPLYTTLPVQRSLTMGVNVNGDVVWMRIWLWIHFGCVCSRCLSFCAHCLCLLVNDLTGKRNKIIWPVRPIKLDQHGSNSEFQKSGARKQC